MKYKELQQKSVPELQKLLFETQEQLQKLEFQMATKRLTNVREIRTLRRTVAQILTALHKNND